MAMHAHRCEHCAKNGKQTVWMHGDDCAGVIASHVCPECGQVQWKKWMVEVAALPKVQTPQGGVNFETVLGYILFFVGLALLGYGTYQYIKDRRTTGKVLPPV